MAQGESQGTGQESVREFRLADSDMRPATVDDVPAIVATLEAGRSLLAADGIDQWQNGTGPDVDLVTEDVERGWGRVFLVDGQVAATAALIDEPEPNYAHMLEGAWRVLEGEAAPAGASSTYATIHRVAVAPAFRGMHVAQRFYARLIEEARARGFAEIRADTHADNVRMQHVIASAGFTRAGTVCMDGNEADQRWAYQLFL